MVKYKLKEISLKLRLGLAYFIKSSKIKFNVINKYLVINKFLNGKLNKNNKILIQIPLINCIIKKNLSTKSKIKVNN
jgi:hypothetical protein